MLYLWISTTHHQSVPYLTLPSWRSSPVDDTHRPDSSVGSFKRNLKTFYFAAAFPFNFVNVWYSPFATSDCPRLWFFQFTQTLCALQLFWIVFYCNKTRSQAVARIADRTASHHLWGHVTPSITWPFDTPYAISYWWSFGRNQASISYSEIINVV